VIVSQDRGYRERLRASRTSQGTAAITIGKWGVDSIFSPVHEALQYAITDPTQFDSRHAVELSVSLSTEMGRRAFDLRAGPDAPGPEWNVGAGLRFDHYGFVVHESAWSPRIGVSRFVPALNLLLHASYDSRFSNARHRESASREFTASRCHQPFGVCDCP